MHPLVIAEIARSRHAEALRVAALRQRAGRPPSPLRRPRRAVGGFMVRAGVRIAGGPVTTGSRLRPAQ